MKTILHISKYYYPDFGGIESVVKQLCEGVTSYRNIVLCYSSDRKSSVTDINGVKVFRAGIFANVMSQPLSLGYYNLYRKIIKQYDPDIAIVHCPNPFAYPMVRMFTPRHTKVVLHWHSDIHEKGYMYNLIRPVESCIMKRADLVIATSQRYIDGSKRLQEVKDKVKVLQNGITTADFNQRPEDAACIEKIRKEYEGKTILLFVGRLIPYKGVDKLIEAEPYIKNDVQILVAGEGYFGHYYRQYAVGHERIKFLGRLSYDEIRQYLWAADIFTFPSITKAEAFGVALAEAMYCRCVPVVFSIEGSGLNWLSLKGETGEEIPLGDVRAYAEAIDRLIDNEPLRRKYAENAHNRVLELFSDKAVTETAERIYDSL